MTNSLSIYAFCISLLQVFVKGGIPIFVLFPPLGNYTEQTSLSSSKSYMRGEIGYVTEVNLVRK